MGKVVDDIWAFLPSDTAYPEGTLAWFIAKRIKEAREPGARRLGETMGYILERLKDDPIGKCQADRLTVADLVNHCRARISGVLPRFAGCTGRLVNRPVSPQTVRQDVTHLRGTLAHFVAMEELEPKALDVFKRAIPKLEKENLIGKGQERTRRPTQEEVDRILAYIDGAHFKIPMRPIVEFQLLTARRISETCRIRWDDLDAEKRTCLVRDLKNPKGKGFHDTFPLLGRAWDIVQAQPRLEGEPRIFPYNAHSISAAYTKIKHALGIKNLRLHDARRECVSKLFEEGYSVPEVAKVSLHRNPTILLKNYTALKPEDLHNGPASRRTN